MQKFSYHTHTNALGIFDGHHSAAEMIRRAEEIGYEEIGISNHLVYHPNLLTTSPMFFNDFDLLKKMMQKNVDDIRRAAEKASIPVYAGFEVDFFPSAMWRNAFEKLTETLNADYYVGSFHFLPAESGYFDFIAHLDVYKIFPDFAPLGTDEDKRAAVETLSRLRHPYELNTSGWTKCGEQHPYGWMLEELNKSGVPVVISDDAHDVDHLARHFERAEELLAKMNYTNRNADAKLQLSHPYRFFRRAQHD